MPTPPSTPNPRQATSHVVRSGRRLATNAPRGRAPFPFIHSDPSNKDARENKPPAPDPMGP